MKLILVVEIKHIFVYKNLMEQINFEKGKKTGFYVKCCR